jgi:hypothetical protein
MDQAALEAAEAQFLAAARAYVANLVKQEMLQIVPPGGGARKDMVVKPGDPRFGRDDQPPGNR